jgi:TPP-dependent pyruvate/acetoin dehydrogenase alpha subunit
MAKFFKNRDFRSGYYRDQTFMMAIGQLTVQQFFAGLYGNTKQNRMSWVDKWGGIYPHSLNEEVLGKI